MFKFFAKSKSSNSAGKISGVVSKLFAKKLDDEVLEELEDILISSDIGSDLALQMTSYLRSQKFKKDISEAEIKNFLAQEIKKILLPCEHGLDFDETIKPYVVVFNGVNGVGKTTTVGKIASNLKSQDKKVLIASCDTFRAAASEQLGVWAKRVGCEIILPQKEGEDPAAVAYRAYDFAKNNNFDVLLIDTAGRLQNKQNLMDELKKIGKVLKKIDINAPHENLLILDAATGQNAKVQMEAFNKAVNITGLIVTKLDGTAKGGIVVSLAQKFKKPIYAIGIGEKVEDLCEFNAELFSKSLIGIND